MLAEVFLPKETLSMVVIVPAGISEEPRYGRGGRDRSTETNPDLPLKTKRAAVHFGQRNVAPRGGQNAFEIHVYLNDLDPQVVRVELYADGIMDGSPVRQEMKRARPLAGASGGYISSAEVPTARTSADYTARVIPFCEGVAILLEEARILWQR